MPLLDEINIVTKSSGQRHDKSTSTPKSKIAVHSKHTTINDSLQQSHEHKDERIESLGSLAEESSNREHV